VKLPTGGDAQQWDKPEARAAHFTLQSLAQIDMAA
jgi:hypothetical protein